MSITRADRRATWKTSPLIGCFRGHRRCGPVSLSRRDTCSDNVAAVSGPPIVRSPVTLGVGGDHRIVDPIQQNRPHLGARALAPDHQMQTVESTQANVGDQQVWRDLIELPDRRLEAGRKHDIVAAVFEQRHRGRLIGPHGDDKDLSHAACLCWTRGFPCVEQVTYRSKNPAQLQDTRMSCVRPIANSFEQTTRLSLGPPVPAPKFACTIANQTGDRERRHPSAVSRRGTAGDGNRLHPGQAPIAFDHLCAHVAFMPL